MDLIRAETRGRARRGDRRLSPGAVAAFPAAPAGTVNSAPVSKTQKTIKHCSQSLLAIIGQQVCECSSFSE